MSLHRTLPLIVMFAACSRSDRRVPPPPKPVAPALAHATQADLGHELDDAYRQGTWAEVKHRWQGQKLRWTVTRQRALCRSADACNVQPFPIQGPAPHGWMPLLTFATGEFERLEAACGEREQCDFTFEGNLDDLDVSGEFPTKLGFANVHVIGTQLARR